MGDVSSSAGASLPGGEPPHSSAWARQRARRRENLRQRRLERHQVWTGEPTALHHAWWRFADLTDLFWVRGLLVAVATWLFLVGLGSIDFFSYRHVPVEDAVVTSVELSPTETISCDRSSSPPRRPSPATGWG